MDRTSVSVWGVLFILAVLALPGAVRGDLVQEVTYRAGEVSISSFGNDHLVELGALPLVGEGAEPVLPVEALVFELDPGTRVTGVEILEVEREPIPGPFRIATADVYLLDRSPGGGGPKGPTPFPEVPVKVGYSGSIGGTRLGSVLVYPLQWIPETGDLVLNRRMVLRVQTGPSEGEPPVRRARSLSPVAEDRWRSILLPAEGGKGAGGARPATAAGPEFFTLDDRTVEYLIVTTDEMTAEFERLARWKTARGMPARVVTLDWILSTYTIGVDVQERIRAFFRDAYESWGTRWVLLGADAGILPTRICRFLIDPYRAYEQGLVPSDFYYACLDGNWNADGDDIFGERDVYGDVNVDFYPELMLGRAPVNTAGEARVFVDKLLGYRKRPAQDYQRRALFMAQQIVESDCPGYHHGASITEACIPWLPPDVAITRLYQCADYFPDSEELDLHGAFTEMDRGYSVVCQVGHGDQYKMDCVTDFFHRYHADSLSNIDRLSFFVLLNCSTGNVDVDCLAERLVRSERGGAIGFVGNSAYGFPSTGRRYQQYLFNLLYGHGITTPGELMTYFRLPFVPMVANQVHRWTQFSYLLLGDPAVDLWIETPKTLSVSHSGVLTLTDSTYAVTVQTGGAPAEGILVCLWMEGSGAYARGRTDASGEVSLPFVPGATGTASLVAIGPGALPVEDSVSVTGSGRTRVRAVAVEDAGTGNGNGRFEAGERVDLAVTLRNDGESAIDAVEANLGLALGDSLRVDVLVDGLRDPSQVWVGSGGWQPTGVPFDLRLGDRKVLGPPPLAVDSQKGVSLWLDATGWHLHLRSGPDSSRVAGTLTASGAVLGVSNVHTESADLVSVTGGNVVEFACRMDTTDFEDRIDLRFADSTGVRVIDGSSNLGPIGPGSDAVGRFTVESDPSVPDGRRVSFVLDVTADGRTASEWVSADIAGLRLDVLYGRLEDGVGKDPAGVRPLEDVSLYAGVINWGAGETGGEFRLRPISGATVSDSVAAIPSLLPGSAFETEDAFVLEATAPDPELEIVYVVDGHLVSRDTLVVGSVAAPESLAYEPGPGRILLTWTRADSIAARGYRVSRRQGGGGAFEYLDVALGSGTYVDMNVEPGQSYEYTVSVFDSSGTLSPPSAGITAWTNPPCQGGYPADATGQAYGSPVAADLDRDGDMEIAVATKEGTVTVLHHDGTVVDGWPQWTGKEIWGSPALGDLDGDGDLEVVVGSLDRKIWVWNWDGSLFNSTNNPGMPAGAPGWPRKTGGELRTAPTLADLDADGRPEILASGWSKDVYCWRFDGTGYIDTTGLFGVTNLRVWGSPAVADLDGDDSLEVVVGTISTGGLGKVFVWNHRGGHFLGSNPFANAAGSIWTSPTIGNIDADPELEILIGSDGGTLYAWNHDGTGVLEPSGVFVSLYGPYQRIRSSPALGDLDGDGWLEIVVGSSESRTLSDTVYAWNHDGTGAMPGGSWVLGTVNELVEDTPTTSSPTLADLDGDGHLEVLIGAHDGRVYAWRSDGDPVGDFPARTRLPVHGCPSVADLDGDGDLEVLVGSYDALVHVWDLPGSPGEIAWNGPQHGPWHRGLYGFSPPPDTTEPAIEIGILQNPVLERSLDLYVSSAENLTTAPEFRLQFGASDTTLASSNLAPGVRDLHLYHASLWLSASQTGEAAISARGGDVAGNEGEAERGFTVAQVTAAVGGSIQTPDGAALLVLGPGALAEDGVILMARVPEAGLPGFPEGPRLRALGDRGMVGYAVGPAGKPLVGAAVLRLKVPRQEDPSEQPALFELRGEEWVAVAGAEAPDGWVGGCIERFGIFKLDFMKESQEITNTHITSSYPNPFNPQTTVHFTVARRGHVTLTVHDVQGRRVATFVDRDLLPGVHRVLWDGTNDAGRAVASGVYFCRLALGSQSSSRKLVLLK